MTTALSIRLILRSNLAQIEDARADQEGDREQQQQLVHARPAEMRFFSNTRTPGILHRPLSAVTTLRSRG